jgi:hypothetical protein
MKTHFNHEFHEYHEYSKSLKFANIHHYGDNAK